MNSTFAKAMKCLTWNLEWASPTSKRLELIRKRIAEADPDVVCYTEVIRSTLPDEGFMIEANPDYGYSNSKSHPARACFHGFA